MAKKQRKKEELFEAVQFEDAERAKRAVTMAKINNIRILIGLGISLITAVLVLIAILAKPDNTDTLLMIGALLAIPAYIIGGGILNALKIAWKITKIGWFVIPYFPMDLFIGAFCFFLSVIGLLFVPVIFVGLNYLKQKKTLDAAKSYLAQCGYAETASAE